MDVIYDKEAGRIIASVSSAMFEPEQLVEHEAFHDRIAKQEIDLVAATETAFRDVTPEEAAEISEQYTEAYAGVYDDIMAIYEEILADAAAGMNRFANVKFKPVIQAVQQLVTETESRAPDAQISEATRRTPPEDEKTAPKGGTKASVDKYSYQGKSMTENSEIYSYDFLTHQPDMKIVELPPLNLLQKKGKIDRAIVAEMGMESLNKAGEQLDRTTARVKNKYTGREIIVAKSALTHGLGGENIPRLRTNARISASAGEIIANAIPINALKNESKNAIGTYAMIALTGRENVDIVAVVTVEQYTNNVLSITAQPIKDQAHAINGRTIKKEAAYRLQETRVTPKNEAPNAATSEFTIAEVIEIVNTTHQSILSDDVLKTLGETRDPKGNYTPSVKFSKNQQLDEQYAMAVRSGDTEAAQKMVEAAAEKAGSSAPLCLFRQHPRSAAASPSRRTPP